MTGRTHNIGDYVEIEGVTREIRLTRWQGNVQHVAFYRGSELCWMTVEEIAHANARYAENMFMWTTPYRVGAH